MQNSLEKVSECPICLEVMKKPIIQCKSGHSVCQICVDSNNVTRCPLCRAGMTRTRNFGLEQLIETLEKTFKSPKPNTSSGKIKCRFTSKGCKYLLEQRERIPHELECKYRQFHCEGKKFCNWQCDWSGSYDDVEKHFKDTHTNHTWMTFKTEAQLKMELSRDFYDIHIINFHNGQNFFWYKHKIDTVKQKVFWTIQMIATKVMAANYYYEFEIFKGPTRKFKIIEICGNDTENAETVFESEKCVVMSFKTLKSYLNDKNELPFKFRIMSVKKHATQ